MIFKNNKPDEKLESLREASVGHVRVTLAQTAARRAARRG